MMRDLIDLVLTWWKCDRIRVRPSEGRLFRLRPGAVLCFSHSPDAPRVSAEVVARRVSRDPDRPRVVYDCRESQSEGELMVTRDCEPEPTVEWFVDGQVFELRADDIEVFQAEHAK